MKQHKISKWLKGVAISLAILGTIFVIAVTIFSFLKTEIHPVGSIIGFPFFTWYTLAVCYTILFQFWKVSKEIGNDNSFSNENVRAFHKMSIGGNTTSHRVFLKILPNSLLGKSWFYLRTIYCL